MASRNVKSATMPLPRAKTLLWAAMNSKCNDQFIVTAESQVKPRNVDVVALDLLIMGDVLFAHWREMMR